MNQHEFDKLLEKYLAGECSTEEEKLIWEWQENMLKNSQLLLNSDEKEAIKKRLWSRIYDNTIGAGEEETSISKKRIFMILKWGIAALLLIGLTNIFLIMKDKKAEVTAETLPTQHSSDIEVKNTSSSDSEIKLEDGTVVKLKKNSSISYPKHFGKETRNVYLKGEAFFKVKRNPNAPFIVHTGDLVTEVLGTSFNVKSYDNSKAIEVSVTSGRVSVYEMSEKLSDKKNGVILTPNQKVVFDKSSKKITPGIVENPIVLTPGVSKIDFVFEEVPLQQVFQRLKDVYGIEIIIENQDLNQCVLTADLNDLPLFTQLELVCRTVNARFEERGTSFFVSGEGCK
ncbi:FecR family protein [Emticicia sp. BO119]|uniref:FecR family protein n=1 Tax=Emticicia sp. BO119 TaxID=2757768 RepID=UPI0015F0B4F9|nr:FecR family protein [Emticicia sp. BO119]MBA4849652.1 FecR family protein [Emticicia sp. BO119]